MIPLKEVAVHATYIAIYFVSIIVLLSTINITKNTDAVNYISFASTLSSLILAVLAIYIGLNGNSSLAGFVAKADKLTEQNFDIQGRIQSFTEQNLISSDALKTQSETFSSLVGELTRITDSVRVLDQKFDQGFASLKTNIQPNFVKLVGGIEHTINTNLVLRAYSFLGSILIFYIMRCLETKTKGSLKLLSEVTSVNFDYLLGCYMSMLAMDMISAEGIDSENIQVSSVKFDIQVLNTEIERKIGLGISPSDIEDRRQKFELVKRMFP